MVTDSQQNLYNTFMSFSERFHRKNIEISEEKGTDVQQDDMAGLVAANSQLLGELGDVLGGRRKRENHPHHPIDALVNAVIDGVSDIIKLRKEINERVNN